MLDGSFITYSDYNNAMAMVSFQFSTNEAEGKRFSVYVFMIREIKIYAKEMSVQIVF